MDLVVSYILVLTCIRYPIPCFLIHLLSPASSGDTGILGRSRIYLLWILCQTTCIKENDLFGISAVDLYLPLQLV
jgi:hypothetical protein